MIELRDGYKDTEIGVIPVEWDVVKLGNVINKTELGVNVKASLDTNGIQLLKMGNLTKGGFNFNKIEKTNDEIANLENYYLKYGDFLFNTRNTPQLVGKSAVWKWNNDDTIFNSNIMRITFTENINSFFYSNYFASDIGWRKLKKISKGTTSVGAIYTKDLVGVKIPLPPLKEQEKIADILSTADRKIDAIATQIEKAQTLKKGLLQKLLIEGITKETPDGRFGHSEFKDSELGKIPLSWEVVELAKLLSFKNGVNASKEQYGKGYRFINVLDIINNLTIRHDDIIGLVDIEEKEFELYEVKYGDILFQRSSETKEEVGQSNVYLDKEQSATFGGFVIKGTAKQEYNPVFMNYLFKIPAIRKQITSKSGGSTRYNIGQNSLNQVVVQFPPLEEQKQIADILSTADEKLEVLRAKKQMYETLKIGLLQKLLSGEVRV